MMATTKISVSVDADTLAALKSLLPAPFNLSALLNDALRDRLHRLEMIALLEEMNREDPPSQADEIAGEALWQRIRSSSIPEPSRSSPKGTKSSVSRRSKR
jgi:hypothetical protein